MEDEEEMKRIAKFLNSLQCNYDVFVLTPCGEPVAKITNVPVIIGEYLNVTVVTTLN